MGNDNYMGMLYTFIHGTIFPKSSTVVPILAPFFQCASKYLVMLHNFGYTLYVMVDHSRQICKCQVCALASLRSSLAFILTSI